MIPRKEFLIVLEDKHKKEKEDYLNRHSKEEIYKYARQICLYESIYEFLTENNSEFTDKQLSLIYKKSNGDVVGELVNYYYGSVRMFDIFDYVEMKQFILYYIDDIMEE